jgi:7,8-didemethyl-8-hydroxy-5-deazariboflavin synthase CofG subunit
VAVFTYVPEYQVVLSRRCTYTCGYCNFPQTPSPFPPSLKQFRRTLRLAVRLGATQITLTSGEAIDKVREIQSTVRYYGFPKWTDYLAALCDAVLEFHGPRVLFPVLDVGRLPFSELRSVVDRVSSVRLLLEAADDRLLASPAHQGAPQKSLEERTVALSELGRLHIPTITGIRIGIGEHPETWALAAQRITGIHRRYRHIQQMVLVPFEPVPYSTMSVCARPTPEVIREATAIIRRVLDPAIPLNVETCDRPAEAGTYLPADSTDLGCVRLGSTDHVNIDAPQAICELKESLAAKDHQLEQRLPWPDSYLRKATLSPRQQAQIELYYNSPKKFTLPITDLTPPSNLAIKLPQSGG